MFADFVNIEGKYTCPYHKKEQTTRYKTQHR